MATKLESSITLVYPCEKDKKKCIVEGSVSGELDPKVLCAALKKSKDVKELKCSEALGLAKFKIDSENITLFKNGRIIIREVENREKAEDIIKRVLNILRQG